MTRRDALSAIGCAAALPGAHEFFNAWLRAQSDAHGTKSLAPPEPDRFTHYQPKFFSRDEMQMLDAFTAILIPTDDTPGARDAHVVPFVDFVVNAAAEYEPELQDDWRTASHFLRKHKFDELPPAEQITFVEKISHPGADGYFTYELIKEMTVHAFYTSRIGLIDVLEYKGNAYLTEFPGCTHREHHEI